MAQENLNTSTPNDGLGDFLRSAFIKVQNMFTELYSTKVDKVVGKDLSKNDFTDVLKNKVDNVEAFAQVNVQSDFAQIDNTKKDFIKNKPTIPVLADYVLNGGYVGTAQDIVNLIPTSGTTTLTFTQINLVSTGDTFFKLPLVLTGTKVILGVKVAITAGNTYGKPASDWVNNEIINFDSNVAQTITVITS